MGKPLDVRGSLRRRKTDEAREVRDRRARRVVEGRKRAGMYGREATAGRARSR